MELRWKFGLHKKREPAAQPAASALFSLSCFLLLLLPVLFLAGCGSEENAADPLAAFPAADMSGYVGLEDYEKPLQFVEVSVAEACAMIDAKESFALLTSFADCPWCNVVVSSINDAALDAGKRIALIDTRKDPSWRSNLDLADYDLFVEYFGKYLSNDDDGTPHLYTPHIFFIKNGAVVSEHQGALPAMGDDPGYELSAAEQKELLKIYKDGLKAIQ